MESEMSSKQHFLTLHSSKLNLRNFFFFVGVSLKMQNKSGEKSFNLSHMLERQVLLSRCQKWKMKLIAQLMRAVFTAVAK